MKNICFSGHSSFTADKGYSSGGGGFLADHKNYVFKSVHSIVLYSLHRTVRLFKLKQGYVLHHTSVSTKDRIRIA